MANDGMGQLMVLLTLIRAAARNAMEHIALTEQRRQESKHPPLVLAGQNAPTGEDLTEMARKHADIAQAEMNSLIVRVEQMKAMGSEPEVTDRSAKTKSPLDLTERNGLPLGDGE